MSLQDMGKPPKRVGKFLIHSSKPIPPRSLKGVTYRETKYPFAQMAVGDHLDFALVVDYNRARQAASGHGRRTGMVFRARQSAEGGGSVWRVL